MIYLIGLAIGVLVYFIVKWLLGKVESLKADAEPVGVIAGFVAFLIYVGVLHL